MTKISEETIQPKPVLRQDIEARKSYLDFTEKDVKALLELKPIIEENLEFLVNSFYQKLLAHERTRVYFKDEATVERLKSAQRGYLRSLVSGSYEEEYFRSRVKIGQIHNIIHLTPCFYLGAYSLYQRMIYPLIFRAFHPDCEKIQAAVLALEKIFNLDMQLAITAYSAAYNEELTLLNRGLEAAKRDLELQVEKRTEELANKNEELATINAELEAFVYTVSHDLKAPIITMTGFSNLLLEQYSDCLDDKGKDYLDRIQKNVKRMDRLIYDLLKLSRISYESKEWSEVDFQKIVQEARDTLHQKIVDSGMDIVLKPPLPRIYCDETRLTEVMINLLDNAIKYRGNNSNPRVEISVREKGDSYEFCVQDNGLGIAPEYCTQAFELFQSLHREGQEESTGVGLCIVKRIIEKHHGKVWLESGKGKGAAVFFTLPKWKQPNP